MQKRESIRRLAREQITILVGSFILAVGINVFMVPGKISAGGVTSLGTVLWYLLGVRLSVTNLLCNLVLFLFGFRILGKRAILQTACGTLYLSLFLEITAYFPTYEGELLIAAISGGVLMGIGIGLIVRIGASTGGSDLAGLILRRLLPHIPLAVLILVIDCGIVVLSGILFQSYTVTFYSVIALFVSSLLTDRIITLGDSAKMLQIFSAKAPELADCIMQDMDRGVTGIHCVGMFARNESLMLECIVKPRELPLYLNLIRQIDPGAFVTIANVQEVLGEGFKRMDQR